MRIILTRHGETLGNINKINEGGRIHGELSPNGLEQVEKLALRLKDEKIDYIYSSDLKRAKDTALEIAKYHPKIKITFTKNLRERDVGDFTGTKYGEVDWSKPPKNFESSEKIQNRAITFFNKIHKKHKTGTIVVVAHAFFNKATLAYMLKKDMEQHNEIEQKNTCVNIFELKEDNNHVLRLLNCVKHLE